MKRVLVIFQAKEAGTESLALAFGLGAVEGGADIRLRHLAGSAPARLEHQGYGRLTNQDIDWAEMIGLGIEAPAAAEELLTLLEQIGAYLTQDRSWKKSAYVFGAAPQSASIKLAQDSLSRLGFSLVKPELPSAEDDLLFLKAAGKHVAGLTHD
jgi:hypothetical protein